MKSKEGKLIVFSAPSGSGKTTIVHHLLGQNGLNLDFSISATSREKRGNEVDGKDYYFISLDQFKSHIEADEFVEWEEVYTNNFYGTLKTEVQSLVMKTEVQNLVLKTENLLSMPGKMLLITELSSIHCTQS